MGESLWAVVWFFLSFFSLTSKLAQLHEGTPAAAARTASNLAFAENSAFLSCDVRLTAYRRMVLLCLLRLVTHDQTNLVKRFICLA